MNKSLKEGEINELKSRSDIQSVISGYVNLKKSGKNYSGLCPFHKEKTPSFSVDTRKQLYHCFGCNAGGDVIGFVCKKEGIGFREAIEKLSNGNGQKTESRPQNREQKRSEDSNSITLNSKLKARLLNRVVSFYHKTFCEDQRALEYLKARGITDNDLFADFKIGYSNGTLLNTIPEEGDVLDALKEIGILNGKGHELFYGCVVFPVFDENKDCVELYGRRLQDGEINHLYLLGPRKGVYSIPRLEPSRRFQFR